MTMNNSTSHILMVRPNSFGFNSDTALDNAFQNGAHTLTTTTIKESAKTEFDNMVQKLQAEGINVHVMEDSLIPVKPDAIFPNNWFTTHTDGNMFLYPMKAPNRRLERSTSIIDYIKENFDVSNISDFSHYEENETFLEGTGSMIFDRVNKICYACISHRTDEKLLKEVCAKLNYSPCLFTSTDDNDQPIYHTNVMLSVATDFVVVCGESIKSTTEKEALYKSFENTGKAIVDVSFEQMRNLCCNVLEVSNNKKKFLVMSAKAYDAFDSSQLETIEKFVGIIATPIPTIEEIGGGGTRCMMAELYFTEKG